MSQKITKLEVSNYMGISEATIEPLKMTVISGKNGKGKTSIVDSIRACLRGAGADKIKLGATKSEIFITTDVIEARRRITAAGSTVTVKKIGSKEAVTKPQAYLDGIIGDFSFEPVRFFLMDVKEQTEYLLKAIPVKATLDQLKTWTRGLLKDIEAVLPLHGLQAIATAEEALYDLRAADNSRVKTLEAAISEVKGRIPAGIKEVKPDEVRVVQDQIAAAKEAALEKTRLENAIKQNEQDQGEMSEELDQITAKFANRDKELADIKASSASLKTVDTTPLLRKLEELKEQMDQIEGERNAAIANNQRKNDADTQIGYLVEGIKDIKSHADHVKGKLAEIKTEGEGFKSSLAKIEVPEMEPLQAQLCDLQTSQAFQRDLDRVSDMTTELKTVKKSADELDRAVKTLQTAAPAEMLAAAAMPVDGLAYSAGQFTLNGVPIQNLSTSQKATLAVAVTRNLNKGYEIKAICLDGFESLDVDTQKAFMEEAAKDDFQYFVTQVQNFDAAGQPLEKLVIESK